MVNITAKEIAELRAKTDMGLMECKKALEETGGDQEKAIEILRKRGGAKAAKRADRETKNGVVDAYIHSNNKVGVLVEVLCETDFVAKTDGFKEFAHNIALQVAAMNPKCIGKEDVPTDEVAKEKEAFLEEVKSSGKPAEIVEKIVEGKLNKFYEEICLLYQPFVKDATLTIEDLLHEQIAKTGEKITISRIARFEIGA